MPQLQLLQDDGTLGEARALGPARLVIGRGRGTDWEIPHARVSARHAAVWTEGRRVLVEDLGAKNGTAVGGRRIDVVTEVPVGGEVLLGGAVRLVLVPDAAGSEDRLGAIEWAVGRLSWYAGLSGMAARLQLLVDDVAAVSRASEVWAIHWEGDPRSGSASVQALARAGEAVPPEPAAISRTVVGSALDRGRAVWIADASTAEGYAEARSVDALSLRSVGCVPIGRRGALYLSEPGKVDAFDADTRLRVEAVCRCVSALVEPPEAAPSPRETLPGMVGDSPPMRELATTVAAFARMPWPVLLLGETGTGKEHVARAVHQLSGREGPFLAVNCGAIPAGLAESTFFGHERGSFTGAERRTDGVVEQVGTGTLFLDEVAELKPDIQVKLLRVLQDGTYRRVGGDQDLRFRGRVVAATHRPVDEDDRGGFREDLYHRLATCVVRLPPLRERRGDIGDLASFLLDRSLADLGAGAPVLVLSRAALGTLAAQAWPGNVRELENAVRRAIARAIATGDRVILPAHLGLGEPAGELPAGELPAGEAQAGSGLAEATDRFQRALVRRAIEESRGNLSHAARVLDLTRQRLYRLLERWPDLDPR